MLTPDSDVLFALAPSKQGFSNTIFTYMLRVPRLQPNEAMKLSMQVW
jgi:hypothetical protein